MASSTTGIRPIAPGAGSGELEPSVAVYFKPEGYETSRPQLMGRQSAGESFLAGLARHSRAPTLGCHAPTPETFAAFDKQIQANAPSPRKTAWVPTIDQEGLAAFGCLYNPGPDLEPHAWKRRMVGEHAHSLCGITHTIASASSMESIGNMLVAPLHRWDALICTSEAVKASALQIVDQYADYLGQRFGSKPKLQPELPVIPLGVDVERFAPNPGARAAWRERLGIAPEHVVFLFVGRLSFHAKAHPLAMYLALERAAQQSGRKVTLIQAGWYWTDGQEQAFVDGARLYCPSVNSVFLDGRDLDVRREIWHAADVFISLSDNIQESFGLTPLEAMAAGLPVIASDWDGYRQTVTHGVSGLMVPTAMPTESAGIEVARRFIHGVDDYDNYIGAASQVIAVDVDAATAACLALIENAALRAELGARGRAQAVERFDWRHIIASYEQLWTELALRRRAAKREAPANRSDMLPPLQANPFRVFANFASRIVGDDLTIEIAVADPPGVLEALVANRMNTSFERLLVPLERRKILLSRIASAGPTTIAALLAELRPTDPDRFRRTVMWMLKCGLIRLLPATGE